MTLVVGDVITSARDAHQAFDRRQTPDASALRFLSTTQGRLADLAAARDASALRAVLTVPLVNDDAAASVRAALAGDGYALPANSTTHDVGILYASGCGLVPVALVSAGLGPYVSHVAGELVGDLAGDAAPRLRIRQPLPDSATALVIGYTPRASELTRLTDVIALPDFAQPVLVAALALFMAKRGPMNPAAAPIPAGAFAADAQVAEAQFLAAISTRSRSRVVTMRGADD